MADDARTGGSTTATAVEDRPEMIPGPKTEDPGENPSAPQAELPKDEDDELEYEMEFATPFGKLEFEFEPKQKKDRRVKARKEKEARESAKKARVAALKAEQKAAKKAQKKGGFPVVPVIILALLALTVLAIWLFARPGEDEDDAVPADYLADPQQPVAPEPQGFVAKSKARLRNAVRAGKRASRDAQREQEEKYQQMTGGR
jgi:hypothetical protein